MRRAIFVALLLSVALLPSFGASGGVIDSVTITGNGDIGEGPISVNISLVGVGGTSTASVSWNASLVNSDGDLIDSDSGNTLVDDGQFSYVETTLANAPIGISTLNVSISGDVGTPGQNQYINYSTTINRLRPIDISLGQPIVNPVDESGNSTGNLTINDGDFVSIEVPVINSGDIDWNGSLDLSVDSIALPSNDVNISGDSTIIVEFLHGHVTEGLHYLNATLNGPSDSDSTDDSYSDSFVVAPPPLPLVELELHRLVEPAPGALTEWILYANNSGESSFNGTLVCTHTGEHILSTNASVSPGESSEFNVSMISKPGEITCTTEGARTSLTIDARDLIEMTSAIFMGAGHTTPSLLGGPWHVGDDIKLSLLVRNEGDAFGSANLRIIVQELTQNGPTISLEDGKAGELTHEFSLNSPGDHVVNWSVVSQDGVIDSNLSGSIIIPVKDSQVLLMEIEDVGIKDGGVEISWSINLTDGRERAVSLSFGSILDGLKGEEISEERILLPGTSYGTTNIGFQKGQEVFAEISVSDWTIGFGSFMDDFAQMPDFSVNPQVTVNPSTTPKVPEAGSKVNVYYTLNNLASGGVPQGQVVATDGNGVVLATKTVQAFSTSSLDSDIVVDWPDGDNVKIRITWHVDGKSVSDEVRVNSKPIEIEQDSFAIPWGGILGGLALGMVIIFAVRIKNSPTKKNKSAFSKNKVNKKSKDEKIEVSCPQCERRLRIPSTYTGAVRCPECDSKFDVEENMGANSEKQIEDARGEKPISSDILWADSDNDILACPKCSRKLKVPYDKRPAKARCPACEIVFEARKNNKG